MRRRSKLALLLLILAGAIVALVAGGAWPVGGSAGDGGTGDPSAGAAAGRDVAPEGGSTDTASRGASSAATRVRVRPEEAPRSPGDAPGAATKGTRPGDTTATEGGAGGTADANAAEPPAAADARVPVVRNPRRLGGRAPFHDGNPVYDVAFLPGGVRVIGASRDGTLKVWDLSTGETVQTLRGHRHWVLSVAVAPDGERAVSGAADGTAREWDLATGEELRTFRAPGGATVQAVALHPGGRLLAITAGSEVVLFDRGDGAEVRRLTGASGDLQGVAFSPAGTVVAAAGTDGALHLWDTDSGRSLPSSLRHDDFVRDVAVSPDGARVATVSDDGRLGLVELGTREATARHVRVATEQSAEGVAFVPGSALVVVVGEGFAGVWDTGTGRRVRELALPTDLRPGEPRHLLSVAVSADGASVVAAGYGGRLFAWRVADGRPLHDDVAAPAGHTAPIVDLTLHPDGRRAATASEDGDVRVWDLVSGVSLQRFGGHERFARAVAFSPDGTRIATGDGVGTVRVRALDDGRELLRLDAGGQPVTCLAFHPTRPLLIAGSWDHRVRVFDLESGGQPRVFAGHELQVEELALTRSGDRVASGARDQRVLVWDPVTLEVRLDRHEPRAGWVESVAWLPDDRRLLVGDQSGRLLLVDTETEEVVWERAAHVDLAGVRTIAVDRAGRRAVTAGQDRVIVVWDLVTLTPTHRLAGHTEVIEAVAITPDGRTIVSAGRDAALLVWDVGD